VNLLGVCTEISLNLTVLYFRTVQKLVVKEYLTAHLSTTTEVFQVVQVQQLQNLQQFNNGK
jgi:hypothetical protein